MKKIEDYTLKEFKETCSQANRCETCIFNRFCKTNDLSQNPEQWDLCTKIFFTEEEVEIAKALKKCFGNNAFAICRVKDGDFPYLENAELRSVCFMSQNAFPTLNLIDHYSISVQSIILNDGVKLSDIQ